MATQGTSNPRSVRKWQLPRSTARHTSSATTTVPLSSWAITSSRTPGARRPIPLCSAPYKRRGRGKQDLRLWRLRQQLGGDRLGMAIRPRGRPLGEEGAHTDRKGCRGYSPPRRQSASCERKRIRPKQFFSSAPRRAHEMTGELAVAIRLRPILSSGELLAPASALIMNAVPPGMRAYPAKQGRCWTWAAR